MRTNWDTDCRSYRYLSVVLSLTFACGGAGIGETAEVRQKALESATTASARAGSQAGMRVDVNQDGNGDVILVYPKVFNGYTSVYISAANGSEAGGFASGVAFNSTWIWSDLAQFFAADVNGDWRSDVIMVYPDGGSSVGLYTALGRSDGVFQPGVHFSTGWAWSDSSQYLVGDVTGEGRADVILVYPDGGNQVGLYTAKGTSDGGFATGVAFQPGWLWSASSKYFVQDVNGDGSDDVLLVYPNPGNVVGLYSARGNSNGGFDRGPSLNTGWEWNPSSKYLVGDVNGDACGDLVLVYPDGGNRVGLYTALGDANGGLSPGGYYGSTWTWNASSQYMMADVNGDRRSDVVVVYPDGKVNIALGDKLGGFTPVAETWLSNWTGGTYYPNNVTGDSKSDLVRVSNSLTSVLLETAVSGGSTFSKGAAFNTSIPWSTKNKYLATGHGQNIPRFQLSAWVDVGLQTLRRGYWQNYSELSEAVPPGSAPITNAKAQIRNTYHANQIYLVYHREFEIAQGKSTFSLWKNEQVTGPSPMLVPALVLQDYADSPGCNFSISELSDLVRWLKRNVNARAIAVFDVYSSLPGDPPTMGRNYCGQLDILAQNFPGEIVRLGIQPAEPLAPQFSSAVADVYGAAAIGKTNLDWVNCGGRDLLNEWVAKRVDNARIAWVYFVVGFGFSENPVCGRGDQWPLEPTPSGRNEWLTHNAIVSQYPGGGAHRNWAGFSVDFTITNSCSVDGGCSSDPYNGQPGLYDAIKAGNPYAGQYSPALNEVADIFSHYNP